MCLWETTKTTTTTLLSMKAKPMTGAVGVSHALILSCSVGRHHGGRGDGERELIADFIAQWNAANPDAQAVLEILPEGAYNEQVQAAALAG